MHTHNFMSCAAYIATKPIAMCCLPHIGLMKFYYLCPSAHSNSNAKAQIRSHFPCIFPLQSSIAKQCSSLTGIDCQLCIFHPRSNVLPDDFHLFIYSLRFSRWRHERCFRRATTDEYTVRSLSWPNWRSERKQAQGTASFSRSFGFFTLSHFLCFRSCSFVCVFDQHIISHYYASSVVNANANAWAYEKQKSTKGISMRDETA